MRNRHLHFLTIGIVLLYSITLAFTNQCYGNIDESNTISPAQESHLNSLQSNPFDKEALSYLYALFISSGEFQAAIDFGQEWLKKWESKADDITLLINYANMAQCFVAIDNIDMALHYLNLSSELLNRAAKEDTEFYYRESFYKIYNSYGVYYVNVEMNYHKAIDYFFKGFEKAEKYNDIRQYTTFGCNLVMTYFLRNDPAGLSYALQLYQYGKSNNNAHITFCGSHISATMYYLMGEYKTALDYIDQARLLNDESYDPVGFYTMYANILMANGYNKMAEPYYLQSIKIGNSAPSTSTTYAYLSYGEYLLKNNDIPNAIDVLTKGLQIAWQKQNTVFRYRFFQNLSLAYQKTGYPEKALEYYIRFHEESDSIFSLERERSINELRIQYEAAKKEKEIEQGQRIVAQQTRKLQTVVFILIIITVITATIFILYQHKNKLYIQLLRQHKKSLADSNSSPENRKLEQKLEEIYGQLEQIMKQEQIYREKDLTVERVAKMLDTNRTYLSKAINEKTGLSFNYYVNSYRIDEAVKVLSDPNNDIAIKTLSYDLGFNSISTFYKLFTDVLGVTPSQFRKHSE